MSKRTSEEIELKIIDMYTNGCSYKEIRDNLKIGLNSIARILKRRDIKLRGWYSKEFEDKELVDNIVYLYENAFAVKHISKILKISEHILGNILKKLNIKRPGKGSKNRINSEKEQEIIKLFQDGMSKLAISKHVQVNVKRIDVILNKNNIENSFLPSGDRHHNWTGGRLIDGNGYIRILLDVNDKYYEMASSNSYIFEHRYVMANHLGRPLTKKETVHHIDGNRQNNDISNLQLRHSNHGPGQQHICCNCGSHNIKQIEL
jgi:transposase